MFNEPVRIIADWLSGTLTDANNATQGVNTKIPLVPIDSGDVAPAAVTVVDETRDSEAALKQVKAGVMQVSVYRETAHGEIGTIYRDGDIPIVIGFSLNKADAWKAKQDESYILRATMFSLAELNLSQNSSKLKRNRINLLAVRDLKVIPAEGKIGDRDVTVALWFIAKVRDTKPHGTEP